MVIKIIGLIWLSTGIMLLVMPGILRWQIRKKSGKVLKRYLFAAVLLTAAFLVALVFRLSGFIPKAIIIIGLFALIKASFSLRSRINKRLFDFLKRQPVMFFRLWALAQALIGLAIVYARW
jgi:hypothetical protein